MLAFLPLPCQKPMLCRRKIMRFSQERDQVLFGKRSSTLGKRSMSFWKEIKYSWKKINEFLERDQGVFLCMSGTLRQQTPMP
jgi:hypothetical protein